MSRNNGATEEEARKNHFESLYDEWGIWIFFGKDNGREPILYKKSVLWLMFLVGLSMFIFSKEFGYKYFGTYLISIALYNLGFLLGHKRGILNGVEWGYESGFKKESFVGKDLPITRRERRLEVKLEEEEQKQREHAEPK